MKTTKTLFLLGALLALTLNAPGQSSPSALTYNGRLADGGNAVNGWYDFTLNLYTNSAGGTPIGNSPQMLTHVGVVNGSFTVTADCGTNLFNGEPRWLEIGVRTNGGNAFATMSPRYTIGSVPVAQYAITPAGSKIGQTQLIENNQNYLAASDGFVWGVVTAGIGNSIPNYPINLRENQNIDLTVYAGFDTNNLISMGGYSAAGNTTVGIYLNSPLTVLVPIHSGQYYKVQGGNYNGNLYFLPFK